MKNIKLLTIDWQRSVIIDSPIDDELVRRFTPKILTLRQQSNDPITVGLDSPGGSLASLEVLLSLLTAPDQDGNSCQIITVATHRAYSAAANFLAFGDYAVALEHAQILCHDVRFRGLEDITPEKAREAAKSLQDTNDHFSLRLAHVIIRRLIWTYIDLKKEFKYIQNTFPEMHEKYSKLVAKYAPKLENNKSVDLASFATTLWAKLSHQNDSLIKNVMERLARWINLMIIAKAAPTYRAKGSRIAGLLDGSRHLHKLFSGRPEHFQMSEDSLKLLISLIISDISSTKTENVDFTLVLERASREFGVLDSMNDAKHIRYASNLMSQHKHVFFADDLDEKPEEEKAAIFAKTAPYATLFWQFCVLLCRELFEGEHILKPNDAQLLGLIDEVCGGGPIQSRREWKIERLKKAKASPAAE